MYQTTIIAQSAIHDYRATVRWVDHNGWWAGSLPRPPRRFFRRKARPVAVPVPAAHPA